MKEPMDRLQNLTSSSLKDFGNHFEDWTLEEKRFKNVGHTLIDVRQKNL